MPDTVKCFVGRLNKWERKSFVVLEFPPGETAQVDNRMSAPTDRIGQAHAPRAVRNDAHPFRKETEHSGVSFRTSALMVSRAIRTRRPARISSPRATGCEPQPTHLPKTHSTDAAQ